MPYATPDIEKFKEKGSAFLSRTNQRPYLENANFEGPFRASILVIQSCDKVSHGRVEMFISISGEIFISISVRCP